MSRLFSVGTDVPLYRSARHGVSSTASSPHGRIYAHKTVTVTVTTLAIELDDGETRVIRRSTDQPVRSRKVQRPPAPMLRFAYQ